MKQTVVILFLLVFGQFFTACNETNDGTYTDPITIYEKMGGDWRLTKLVQIDEIAKASSIKPNQITLTNEFNFKTFNISFRVDDAFQPTSYEVTGDAPELFMKSGFWELSNPFPNTDGTAVKILLYSDEEKSILVDQLDIAALPGSRGTMDFNVARSSGALPFVTYQYSIKLIQ